MNFKSVIAAIILAIINLSAQAEGMYGTLGIGSTSNWGSGFTLAVGKSDIAALQLNKKNILIAVEAGYVDFGSKRDFDSSKKASAFYGAAVGTFDLQNKLSANVKLGLSIGTSDKCAPGGCVSGSNSGLLFGAGVQYDLGGDLSAGVDYKIFDGSGFFGFNGSMKF